MRFELAPLKSRYTPAQLARRQRRMLKRRTDSNRMVERTARPTRLWSELNELTASRSSRTGLHLEPALFMAAAASLLGRRKGRHS
jgi:hypothetical protein